MCSIFFRKVPASLSWFVIFASSMVYVFAFLSACRPEFVSKESQSSTSNVACAVSEVRYPTNREDFQLLYLGRGFYVDGKHLGHDIELKEGTPIYPIACGTVRLYRSASGYGSLVVVIEHRLPKPLVVKNGLGAQVTITSFFTIYGHLRATTLANGWSPLAIRVGDTVGPHDIIGYVEGDDLNGDGAEHLHLGIRLQSVEDAKATDRDWFRGYDTSPSQRQWFADPADFLNALMTQGIAVRWHPAGTLLASRTRPDDLWMVEEDDVIRPVDEFGFYMDRLKGRSIEVSDEELACYTKGRLYVPELHASRLVKFDDASTVYEYREVPEPHRYSFISDQAFQSWGWKSSEIMVQPARERADFFARYRDRGFRRLRAGTLVKGRGLMEVAAVSNERRLPILDWSTFLALGYQADRIVEVDPAVLAEVAYPRGPLITPEIATYCAHPKLCLHGECKDAGTGGGGIETDANTPPDMSLPSPDLNRALKQPEICNGLDDDGNGMTDEVFPCPLGRRGPICVTSCGVNGYRLCEAPACDWSTTCYPFPENCDNTIDDDCDGKTDCADPDCRTAQNCQPMPVDAAMPTDAGISPPDLNNAARLYIEAGAHLKAGCQSGIIVVIWDPLGRELRSKPGTPLDIPLEPNWRSWLMMTTVCGNLYHGNWMPKEGSAKDAGFASVKVGARELVSTPKMVCVDPWSGMQDIKLAVPLEQGLEGTCP